MFSHSAELVLSKKLGPPLLNLFKFEKPGKSTDGRPIFLGETSSAELLNFLVPTSVFQF